MAAINKVKIRNQISKAIEKLPTTIFLKRDIASGTEASYILYETDVATFDAFLDTSKSGKKQGVGTEDSLTASAVTKINGISLLTVADDSFDIKKDDYFMLNDIKYRIVYPNNNYGIYWDCDIEVVS